MRFTTMVSENEDIWQLVFGIDFRPRRKHKIWVEATNRRTKERLTMPNDRERITALLDFDMWPRFATDEFSTTQPTLEGLFHHE